MGTALITGASAGLGYEFAKLFAKDTHSLILVARRRSLLEKKAAEIKALYPLIHIEIMDMDLGVPGAGKDLFQRVRALGLQVDYLVNNAGFGTTGEFKNLPLDKELQMMDLNMRSLVELTHLFLPAMLQRHSGKILNVGSTAGFQCGPNMATYFATKAFVNSFSEALNYELKNSGVTCTVLAPGATATEFAQVSGTDKLLLFSAAVADAASVARDGYKGMFAGRSLVVSGLKNKIMLQLLRIAPRWLTRKVTAYLTGSLA